MANPRCAHCGRGLPTGARFCPGCGFPVARATARPRSGLRAFVSIATIFVLILCCFASMGWPLLAAAVGATIDGDVGVGDVGCRR